MSSAVCATMNWSEETGDGGASIPANKGHVSWSQAHTSDRLGFYPFLAFYRLIVVISNPEQRKVLAWIEARMVT